MAILDVEQSKQQGSTGIKRELDENAHSLIMDTIQVTQYQYPEASTVRELTSNAIDSQNEKTKAIEIITGKKTEEDYYIRREDAQYKDSNFDREYYDLKWLNQDLNEVELTYKCGTGGGWCDQLIVKDHGVGLGGKRLQGYFKIGFSTKRNTTKALGGFGFGAKVSLSLRNEYYDVVTAHNGKLFKFRCYAYKLDSLVSKFKENGETNNFIEFSDSKGNTEKVYYEDTTSKNFTELIVPCKTYHRTKINDAINSQLLYLTGIKYNYIDESGYGNIRKFQANILYNSKNLIVSDQRTYAKPHVVVVKDPEQSTGICYGYVNFHELEMQDLYSYVGFKCPMRQVIRDESGKETVVQDGVEVTPSRESVVWSDNTRNYLQKIITSAAEEAQSLVNDQLKEKDFLEWIRKAVAIKSGSNSDWTLSNIAKITDVTNLHPSYSVDPDIKLCSVNEFFAGFQIRHNIIDSAYKRNIGSYVNFINRKSVGSWSDVMSFNTKFYKYTDRQSPRKDEYVLRQNNNRFISIKRLTKEEMFNNLFKNDFDHPTQSFCKNEKAFEKLFAVSEKIYSYFWKHKSILDYDEVDVPESFKSQLKDEVEIEKEDQDAKKATDPYAGMTPAERRKLTDSLVLQHLQLHLTPYGMVNSQKPVSYAKKEMLASDFVNDNAQVYYANGIEEQGLTTIASLISHPHAISFDVKHNHNFTSSVFNPSLRIIRVPSNMPKKFTKNHKHIYEFFGFKELYTDKDKTITMNDRVKKWNTLRLINADFEKFKFLSNFSTINPDISKIYTEVSSEMSTFTDFTTQRWQSVVQVPKDVFDGFETFLSKVTQFALFKADNPNDTEGLKNKAIELFGTESITDVESIDFELYNKYLALKEYSSQIHGLLNFVDFKNIKDDGKQVIYKILDAYGLTTFNLKDFGIEFATEEDVLEVIETTETDPVEDSF